MITMYKNGKACNADPDQVEAMVAGGWSTSPEQTAAQDGGEDAGGEDAGGEDAGGEEAKTRKKR